ncbi:flagellar hook-basal body protein FliE [Lysinibacillus sphaericus]|uniref:Flagellar hook-basal body complex protein FliE n=1 Tax=Lysinibacillus zambalensis TaxID=3160866 RepID=A0ABV1MV63_9BACI|nr:flagellar hook-basal body complex protein FliE [Lysinibacillus sphaericus]MBG9455173.1 flagellar hook-basal body protein FliE [Lysinibacillus sphaericus]MBG9478717.1 flagellar hook-basal body protein FliE [Lysinibacillus sphaericus]MBG9592444.1 flagellar hook-basal body protein FliE [Lysinibacillus sphaericus]
MTISSVSQMTPTQVVNETNKLNVTPYEAQQSFANSLKEAISKVNDQQITSDNLTQKLINGGDVELHEVMIASQKASITLNATIEVRNKVIEAYQEIMRMSV